LRKAANEIFRLLADRDPGAKDCLKANRATYPWNTEFVRGGHTSGSAFCAKKQGFWPQLSDTLQLLKDLILTERSAPSP